MKHVVFCDIDHCVANSFWRDAMIGGEGGWDAYHEQAKHDKPVPEMVRLFKALSGSFQLVGLTARPEKWRSLTLRWMLAHSVPLKAVLMRPDDNFQPAPILKVALARRYFDGDENRLLTGTAFVLDDRDDVATAFRGLGITVLQVHLRNI